jgi:hypothetical protein
MAVFCDSLFLFSSQKSSCHDLESLIFDSFFFFSNVDSNLFDIHSFLIIIQKFINRFLVHDQEFWYIFLVLLVGHSHFVLGENPQNQSFFEVYIARLPLFLEGLKNDSSHELISHFFVIQNSDRQFCQSPRSLSLQN